MANNIQLYMLVNPIHNHISKLPWVDCLGGLGVGLVVVIFQNDLTSLYDLPAQVILFLGVMNFAYGCFSFSIAMRNRRSLSMVKVLSVANILWAPVCWIIFSIYNSQISILGAIHLMGESLYVGLLGVLEWKYRYIISSNQS